MRVATLSVGFIPLVDAAPLIVAQEMGFAAEEGIALNLQRAPSWSSLRDMLSFGQVDAAHMLSPVPVAAAMGLGGSGGALSAVSVMSVNGNVIGVNNALAERLRAHGHEFSFNDAFEAGRALLAISDSPLRIGVPFPFSMHAELVFYWLTALDPQAEKKIEIRTVPPPLMSEAIAADEIDAFCVGEPWGSRAVDKGLGALLLPGTAIWAFSPESEQIGQFRLGCIRGPGPIEARGPQETPHGGADQGRGWGWRRTRSEPTVRDYTPGEFTEYSMPTATR